MAHRRKRRFKLKSLHVWHRYIGLGAALFVLLLSTSGIALNHTDELALGHRYVRSPLLLERYGIHAPDAAVASTTEHGGVALLGSRLYVNERPVNGTFTRLFGAVAFGTLVLVAIDHDILLIDAEGHYLERLSVGASAPGPVERIGIEGGGGLVIETREGRYTTDAQLIEWQAWERNPADVSWDMPQTVSGQAIAALRADYLGQILTWERVLLDLHSGRVFGQAARWLMDAAAVGMLGLAASGMVLWWRRRR